MKRTWRFLLGAAIGAGVGYAMVLLVKPAPRARPSRWQSLYEASEQTEEQTAD